MYKKDEKKIVFTDIEDSLALVISSFSTITSYENLSRVRVRKGYLKFKSGLEKTVGNLFYREQS